MSRNIVPRANKDADLGTPEKNWNKLHTDAVILRGEDLRSILDGKTNLGTLTAKGDLYVATGPGVVTRLPAGKDGYVLKSNQGVPEGLMWGPAEARQELTGDITVTVGNGGDFPTINAALENVVALYYPKYIANGNCPRVTIHLLSGFVMSEQVLVESLDLSWITITGVDAETVINRSALTTSWGSGYPAFGAMNGGFLPIIGQLFNMDTSGTASNRHGILAYSNSRAIVLNGCGVKNAGYFGIYAARSSTIDAHGVNASGAGAYGIYAIRSSTINAGGADASGANTYGIYAEHGSTIYADGADASGAGTYGIFAYHSSTISADGADASEAGTYGIYASHGSTIDADGADASGAGTYGIYATRSSTINAHGANASRAGTYGIYAGRGSTINAYGADASGAGTYGICANLGSTINANGATGTLNQAKNTLTANGIIFQVQ